MASIIVARVVDLPLPVGPVTTTSPSRSSANLSARGGSPSSANDLNTESMRLRAMLWRSEARKTLNL